MSLARKRIIGIYAPTLLFMWSVLAMIVTAHEVITPPIYLICGVLAIASILWFAVGMVIVSNAEAALENNKQQEEEAVTCP